MSEAKREPLFHISKRTDISWQKALLIRVIAIALALGASAIICLLLTDDDPGSPFTAPSSKARSARRARRG